MKLHRTLVAGLLAAALLAGATGAVATDAIRKQIEVEYRGMKITVDDQTVAIPSDLEPFLYLEKGRTYVPARPLAEALGAEVGWDAETSTVKVYSKTYATSTREGDLNVWTMPAHKFSIKAPVGFVRQELGFAVLQLGPLDPMGTSPMVAVQRLSPDDRSSGIKLMEVMIGLQLTFLRDLSPLPSTEENGYLTMRGSAKFLGSVPSTFAVRLIPHAQGDWVLFALVPDSLKEQMEGVTDAVLNSFALLP